MLWGRVTYSWLWLIDVTAGIQYLQVGHAGHLKIALIVCAGKCIEMNANKSIGIDPQEQSFLAKFCEREE